MKVLRRKEMRMATMKAAVVKRYTEVTIGNMVGQVQGMPARS